MITTAELAHERMAELRREATRAGRSPRAHVLRTAVRRMRAARSTR